MKEIYESYSEYQKVNAPYIKNYSSYYPYGFGKLFLALPRELKILDVGCGPGFLLHWLLRMGFKRIEGIDFSKSQVKMAREHFNRQICIYERDVTEFAAEKKESYDAIVLFDVLEHIGKDKALAFLEALRSMLKKNGFLFIRVPNMANLFAAQLRYIDFTHEVGFTEHSLRQLLSCCGFSEIFFSNSSDGLNWKGRILFQINTMLHKILSKIVGCPSSSGYDHLIKVRCKKAE
jgi:2-polyprenyl-3-methyl-5-hydroxy-6-metoxy-1,4-benzoquinol methylase